MVVLLGNQTRRSASALFVNGMRIEKYQFEAGVLKWASSPAVPFSGVLKFDDQQSGLRRLIGRTWAADRTPAEGEGFVAAEVNPGRAALAPRLAEFRRSLDLSAISGDYALRASGRFSREVMRLSISLETMSIDGQPVSAFRLEQGGLVWTGGQKSCFSGRLEFLHEPIAGGVDLYGQTQSNDEPGTFKCYGTRLVDHAAQGGAADYHGPPLPDWAAAQLMRIVSDSAASGGLMLWHKWEKYNFTSLAVCKYVAGMV
jgi:hypothetical protein